MSPGEYPSPLMPPNAPNVPLLRRDQVIEERKTKKDYYRKLALKRREGDRVSYERLHASGTIAEARLGRRSHAWLPWWSPTYANRKRLPLTSASRLRILGDMKQELVDFRLPDGRIVGIHADVARFHNFLTYQLSGGKIVIAWRVVRI